MKNLILKNMKLLVAIYAIFVFSYLTYTQRFNIRAQITKYDLEKCPEADESCRLFYSERLAYFDKQRTK
jgi:hypothetical protein